MIWVLLPLLGFIVMAYWLIKERETNPVSILATAAVGVWAAYELYWYAPPGLFWIAGIGLVIALYSLFHKKSFPSDPQEYADKARTNPVNSSLAGSLTEKFQAENTVRTIEARKEVAAKLGELYKTEGQARVDKQENEYQVLRNELKFALEQLQHTNAEAQLSEATRRKVSPVMSDQMVFEEHKVEQTIRLKEAESEIEMQRTKALQEQEVELDFRKKMNTLAAITRYRHLQFDAFDEVRGRLISLLEEVHRVENSNMDVYLKGDIITQMKQAIDAYQEVFNVYRRRLVESGHGEEAGQIASITDLTGGGGTSGTPALIQVPFAESGERD